MPNSDIFDRKEGYGHTDGTVAAGKDTLAAGSTAAQWQADTLTVPAQADETTNARLARLVDTKDADDRRIGAVTQSPDLFDRSEGYGHIDATDASQPDDDMTADIANNDPALTYSGTNTALTTASTETNTSRTNDIMDSTERAATGFADRTSGWGHSAADAPADLKDA